MKDVKTVHFGIRIEEEMAKQLDDLCPEPFGNKSDLARNILKDWLKKNYKKMFDSVKRQ